MRQCRKAGQPVGHDGGRQHNGLGRKGLQRLVGERHLRQAAQHRLTELGGQHRRHERNLVLQAAPGLAACTLAAQVGVVHLDAASELARIFSQPHDFHDLVLELQRRGAVLGSCQQVHGQEPTRQGQLGSLKNRSANQAGLVSAVNKLPVQQTIAPKRQAVRACALAAYEALRPARADDDPLALVLAAVPLEELRHRQSLLKLNAVHSHGSPLSWMTSSSGSCSSQGEPRPRHTEVCH